MRDIISLLMFFASTVGALLGLLLAWQALVAIGRLILASHSTAMVSLLLERLSAAMREGRTWGPALRGLRLEMPWPWPWRLGRAADQMEAGMLPAEVLATSSLLPTGLRAQAAQALHQGPGAFAQWCAAIAARERTNPLIIRQQAFLLAEGAAVVGMLCFLSVFILPKFEQIMLDLAIPPPPMLVAWQCLLPLATPLLAAAVAAGMILWSLVLARRWRRRRRQAAARLLLAGSLARLPEAALGAAGGFTELCAAAGWQATDPAELARRLADEERRDAMRQAWLPSLAAAFAPVVVAVPIGLVVIGIMQILVSLITSVEAQS
jgi:hypothetical protein